MNYKQIGNSFNLFAKLFQTTKIKNYEEAVALSLIKPEMDKLQAAWQKGNNAIVFKYSDLAKKRESPLNPNGYNSLEEQKSRVEDIKKFDDKTADISLPVLSKETIKILFEDEGELSLSAGDLATLDLLGMTLR